MRDMLWLFHYDDSPMFARREMGWDKKRPNPYCFNCEHTLARHENLSLPWSQAREHGAEGTCTKDDCTCASYYPSHTVPLEDEFTELSSISVRITEITPVGIDSKGNFVYVDSETGYHYADGQRFTGELTVQMQGQNVKTINVA